LFKIKNTRPIINSTPMDCIFGRGWIWFRSSICFLLYGQVTP